MKTKHSQQFAALPVRIVAGTTEVMLITSRQTRRWVIPKGWPIEGLSPRQVAAREAYEEAGVIGRIGKHPIGVYDYAKRLSADNAIMCTVTVFLLQVEEQVDDWPEKNDRQRCWMAPTVAARCVEEYGLSALLCLVEASGLPKPGHKLAPAPAGLPG